MMMMMKMMMMKKKMKMMMMMMRKRKRKRKSQKKLDHLPKQQIQRNQEQVKMRASHLGRLNRRLGCEKQGCEKGCSDIGWNRCWIRRWFGGLCRCEKRFCEDCGRAPKAQERVR